MEHRWGQRVVVDVPIRLVAGPFSGRSARLTNLSVSGGCIKSSFELRPLARVELAIELHLRFAHATPLLIAYVTRTFKGGVGIEWCEFAPAAISELIRSATPRRYGYPRRSVAPSRLLPQPDSVPTHAPKPPRSPEARNGAEASQAQQLLSPAPQALLPQALLKHGT
jgi:hypothetical protein